MEEQKGATATITKTVSHQRFGSGNSIEIPMQKRNVRMHGTRKRWWGDPSYRVSHVSVAWQPRVVHETNGHGANTGFISYHTTFVHGGHLNVIPLKRVFSGGNEFDGKDTEASRQRGRGDVGGSRGAGHEQQLPEAGSSAAAVMAHVVTARQGSSGRLHAFRSEAWVRARVERPEGELLALDTNGTKEEEPGRGANGGGTKEVAKSLGRRRACWISRGTSKALWQRPWFGGRPHGEDPREAGSGAATMVLHSSWFSSGEESWWRGRGGVGSGVVPWRWC
ncbi:hypothetical protein TRIUR3_29363 [Triticum urartu]|uniref:Uncharacterized protein n=1 Tax=Triticum urartu TaxID=4572 RepID=M7YZT2_TRIUA|nr:hypothetical protein TRIUR3_29363 [Triticum urartu]